MSAYTAIRDWVDRDWARPASGIVLPVPLVFLVAFWLDNEAFTAAAWIGFGIWACFCAWRWWLQMRVALAGGDAFGVRNRKNKKTKSNG